MRRPLLVDTLLFYLLPVWEGIEDGGVKDK